MITCGSENVLYRNDGPMSEEERTRAITVLTDACVRMGTRCVLRKAKGHHRSAGAKIPVHKFAGAIEHGIAVWSEAKTKTYRRKLYSILWAMRDDPNLFTRFDPWDLAYIKEDLLLVADSAAASSSGPLSVVEVVSDLEKALKERLVLHKGSSSQRACTRCGSTDLERIALQLRSADEGMTQMMQCTSCNHRFK